MTERGAAENRTWLKAQWKVDVCGVVFEAWNGVGMLLGF